MKKLIMGLAAVALAGSLHAATAAWGMSNDGAKTYANATVYMVLNSNFDAAISALNAGGSDIATTMAGYDLDASVVTLSGKGAGKGSYASATSGQSYNWILVMRLQQAHLRQQITRSSTPQRTCLLVLRARLVLLNLRAGFCFSSASRVLPSSVSARKEVKVQSLKFKLCT